MEQENQVIGNVIVEPDLKASNKLQAITLLIDKVFTDSRYRNVKITRQQVFDQVMEREKTSTTGIGQALAIPHSRIDGWNDFALAIGINREGIDFDSLDGEPVKVVCLMISPSEKPYMILQTTAALISFFEKYKGAGNFIAGNSSGDDLKKELSTIIMQQEHILAKDVTRPVQAKVMLDDSVEYATRQMHLKHFDVLPVVDSDNKFCGQISCLDIFKYGMPDFFQNRLPAKHRNV